MYYVLYIKWFTCPICTYHRHTHTNTHTYTQNTQYTQPIHPITCFSFSPSYEIPPAFQCTILFRLLFNAWNGIRNIIPTLPLSPLKNTTRQHVRVFGVLLFSKPFVSNINDINAIKIVHQIRRHEFVSWIEYINYTVFV